MLLLNRNMAGAFCLSESKYTDKLIIQQKLFFDFLIRLILRGCGGGDSCSYPIAFCTQGLRPGTRARRTPAFTSHGLLLRKRMRR